MIAPDRVVMGDGAAVRNHRIERRTPLIARHCAWLALFAERVEREIRRGPVRIDMGEPTGDLALTAGCGEDRVGGRGLDRVVEFLSKRSHVIAVSNVSLITPRKIDRSMA